MRALSEVYFESKRQIPDRNAFLDLLTTISPAYQSKGNLSEILFPCSNAEVLADRLLQIVNPDLSSTERKNLLITPDLEHLKFYSVHIVQIYPRLILTSGFNFILYLKTTTTISSLNINTKSWNSSNNQYTLDYIVVVILLSLVRVSSSCRCLFWIRSNSFSFKLFCIYFDSVNPRVRAKKRPS